MVRSCYSLTTEYATCCLARYVRARTLYKIGLAVGGSRRTPRVSVEQMEDFIGRRCRLRRNLLIHQLEAHLREGAGEEEPCWQPMTGMPENSLCRYYSTKTNSQRLTKDDLFTMAENLLVNFEEIDSMHHAASRTEPALKTLATTLCINERSVYGCNKVRCPA